MACLDFDDYTTKSVEELKEKAYEQCLAGDWTDQEMEIRERYQEKIYEISNEITAIEQ